MGGSQLFFIDSTVSVLSGPCELYHGQNHGLSVKTINLVDIWEMFKGF